MAYQTPITIDEAIREIKRQKYVLPSIQREFVWSADQIEKLFDSLMRGYPIGTFLFWKIEKDKINDFQFYKFMNKFHEKDYRHNEKAILSSEEDVMALLDGQQRVTSIYLSLQGTYAYKRPYMARNNPNAYPAKKLYLNLTHPSDDLELEYDFRFLSEEELSNSPDDVFWFECSAILSLKSKNDMYDYLDANDLSDTAKHSKEITKFIRNTINRFHDVIYKDGIISYYKEEEQDIDKVLQIFIRINSGGTELSYSDLLLSVATAQWEEKDARELIHEFVDDINSIGDGFTFTKDLVLKNCLVSADFTDVTFKANNFNKQNMIKIEKNWEEISTSLRKAVELLAILGYNSENLTAANAVIPIAYFILKNKCKEQILHHQKWEQDRKAIGEWLARVLLKGTFGGTPDSLYPAMRTLINNNLGRFPLQEIIKFYRGKRKSISFNTDEINNLLDLEYNKAKTYCALTLIYPGLNRSFRYHQDHVHPKSKFNRNSMKALKYDSDDIEKFNELANNIANLQLLESTVNLEKSSQPFKEWLEACYPQQVDRDRFLQQHHINPGQSLEFKGFLDFVAVRKKTIRDLLIKNLNAAADETFDEDDE